MTLATPRRCYAAVLAVVATTLAFVFPSASAAAMPPQMPPSAISAPLATSVPSATTVLELTGICALKSNGLMRVATSPDDCDKNERYVSVTPGPIHVCVQPSGSSRYVTSLSKCRKPALGVTLPPLSGTESFCAAASGVLRYVTDPSECLADETAYQVIPADDAPAVTAVTPSDGATGLGTLVTPEVTFSEPVTLDAGALALSCGGVVVAGTMTGSGTTATFDPSQALPEGATCTLTIHATAVRDTDTIDPPDTMAADFTSSFTTDAAPTLVSINPVDGATGVSVSTSVTLTFSELVNISSGAIALTCGGTPVAGSVTITMGSGRTTVTIHPAADLPPATTCTTKVTASGITDTDLGDPPNTMTADVTRTFTTADAAPEVVAVTPADQANDVAANSDIVVTFSEPVTASDGAITVACPTGTPIEVTLSGSPGTTITAHPTSALPQAVTCTVTVVAAHVSDTDAVDPPDTLAADVTTTFTVSANSAPTDLTLSSSTIAENEPVGTAIGTFGTTDADAGDTFTYSLVAGTGDTDNGSFSITGAGLVSAAVFDFEAKSSYSIRVRTTDAAGATYEKAFTINITDVNERPSPPTLSNSAIAENQPIGSLLGSLSSTDPDAGQTLTYSVVTTGCSGTFPDGSAFTVSGTSLLTTAVLNYEAKSSFAVCLRVTDNGSPALSNDHQVTITVTNVNEAPVTNPDSYSGVIGNTLARVGSSSAGAVTLTGALPITNDSDPDGDTLHAVPETVTTTQGGTATIAADGSFSYLPPVGARNVSDTFTYHATDGTLTSAGTVTIAIGTTVVWYVDNASTSATHDGRSTSPLTSLTQLNGLGGASDLDQPGDDIFLAAGSSPYAGGLALEANQRLIGSLAGLTVSGTDLIPPTATAPAITNAAGNGLDLATGVSVQGVNISLASGDGIHGSSVTTVSVGTSSPVTVTGSGGDGVELAGAAGGVVNIAATINTSAGRSVAVSGRTGGTTTFTGAITGTGISLTNNVGATVAFTGTLNISSGTASAFAATGGGTVTVTGSDNTLTSATSTALVVENTTIGAAGLTFRSVSSYGAPNGIRLVSTGSSGGLTVTGVGSTFGGDGSGGTIHNSTGAGILLSATRTVNLANLRVTGSVGPGIAGTRVTNFSLTDSTVSGSGGSTLAFNHTTSGGNNLDGAVSVTRNIISDPSASGIEIYNQAGTISALKIDNNSITSTSATGSAVLVQALGHTGGAASVTGGSVSGNDIMGFPTGGGVLLYGGNVTGASAPPSTFGSSGTPVTVSNNLIRGTSSSAPMNTQFILLSMAGRGTGFVNVTNNGTVINPLRFGRGNAISINSTGDFTLTSSVTGNVVSPTTQLSGTYGIAGGSDRQVLADGTTADTAVLNVTVTSNNVSQTTSSGIRFLANSSGTLRARITNNTVAAPTGDGGSTGIRVDSGTSAGTAVDTTVCLDLANNVTAGGVNSALASTAPGIGLRKQGGLATTNDFGIVGLTPSPATGNQTAAFVGPKNTSTAGTGAYGTGTVFIVSGSNFVSCSLPF